MEEFGKVFEEVVLRLVKAERDIAELKEIINRKDQINSMLMALAPNLIG